MRHPLDHDGNGKPGGSLPKAKRGRPAKAAVEAAKAPSVASKGSLRVKAPDTIFDGNGGFYPVGHMFDPVDAETSAALIARGFAE